MLSVYIPDYELNVSNCIFDVEKSFYVIANQCYKQEYFEGVIQNIEHGEVIEKGIIKTIFGFATISQISTGAKALLLALYKPKAIVNFREAGNNVVAYALKLSKKYDLSIYLDREVPGIRTNESVLLNGEKIVTFDELNNAIEKGLGMK